MYWLIKKSGKRNKRKFKSILIINLLLVMLLAAALFIFMILIKSINPELTRDLMVMTYVFIVVLVLLAGITGIMIFLILSKRRMI